MPPLRDACPVVRLGETQARVAALKSIQRSRPQPLGAPLADAVRARADAAGFALVSLDPDGDRIRIAIATAKPGALLAWIAGLEGEGVLVDGLAITGNGDGTSRRSDAQGALGMRRLRLRTAPGAFFLGLFALAMLAFLPLRLASAGSGSPSRGCPRAA